MYISRLKQSDFKRFIGSNYYFLRFTHKKEQYELCFEPCYSGFCIAIYKRFAKARFPQIVTFKRCTLEEGYLSDTFGLSDRSEKTWNNAIRIAQEIINEYFKRI